MPSYSSQTFRWRSMVEASQSLQPSGASARNQVQFTPHSCPRASKRSGSYWSSMCPSKSHEGFLAGASDGHGIMIEKGTNKSNNISRSWLVLTFAQHVHSNLLWRRIFTVSALVYKNHQKTSKIIDHISAPESYKVTVPQCRNVGRTKRFNKGRKGGALKVSAVWARCAATNSPSAAPKECPV